MTTLTLNPKAKREHPPLPNSENSASEFINSKLWTKLRQTIDSYPERVLLGHRLLELWLNPNVVWMNRNTVNLWYAFVWTDTPQGHDYWHDFHHKLLEENDAYAQWCS